MNETTIPGSTPPAPVATPQKTEVVYGSGQHRGPMHPPAPALCPHCGNFRGGHATGSFDICDCHSPKANQIGGCPTNPTPTTSKPSATAPVRVQPDCSAFALLREILTKDREAIQEMRATAPWYQPPADLLDLHKRIEACLSPNTERSGGGL